jgi:hypothetical protein
VEVAVIEQPVQRLFQQPVVVVLEALVLVAELEALVLVVVQAELEQLVDPPLWVLSVD